ncbi:MAG: histidine phosphatase family protein [Beijerinckiaceae bacterium]|nr:histidine phosphatase family protein [Beijerinckiaceae bacterium]MCZ8299250.1 histidine phosphatase family protein [Beijerinckiaceae bacterium]
MAGSLPARAAEGPAWDSLLRGAIVLFRHSNAPGTGDPPGFRLGDCTTQRNLDQAGRDQARRIGEAFRSRGIAVGQVLASRWCRAQETASLAFPGRVVGEPAFDSFFDARERREAATAAARRILEGWQGPGALVVATHQVNITALTGIVPRSGEGVVLRIENGEFRIIGRIQP